MTIVIIALAFINAIILSQYDPAQKRMNYVMVCGMIIIALHVFEKKSLMKAVREANYQVQEQALFIKLSAGKYAYGKDEERTEHGVSDEKRNQGH